MFWFFPTLTLTPDGQSLMYSMEQRSLLPWYWTWIVDFLNHGCKKEYRDAGPSDRQPLNLSGFQVLARLPVIGKRGLLQKVSSLVGSTRWNLETYRAKAQISFLCKNRKGALPFFILQRKKKLFSSMRRQRRAFFLQTSFVLCTPTQQVVNLFTKGWIFWNIHFRATDKNLLVLWPTLNTVCIEIIFISMWIVLLWVQELEMMELKINGKSWQLSMLSFSLKF